jgi:drug/metabolite transporter (DMT)-like permease
MSQNTLKSQVQSNRAVIFGYCSIILGIILFSSVEVFSKLVTTSKFYPPHFWISAIRFLLAGIVFIPSFFSYPRFKFKDLVGIFICSIFSVTLAITCFFQVSLMPRFHLDAGIAAIIFCSNPIIVMILSPLIARRYHTGLHRISGAFIALIGVIVASWSAIEGFGSSFDGMILMFFAAILFGAQVPYSKKYLLEYGGMKYLGALFLMGGVTSAIIAYSFEGLPTLDQMSYSLWPMLGYSFIPGVLGYYFYFQGFRHVDLSRGSQFFFLKPILAPIIAFFILGEALSWTLAGGVIIILLGIKWSFIPKKKEAYDL